MAETNQKPAAAKPAAAKPAIAKKVAAPKKPAAKKAAAKKESPKKSDTKKSAAKKTNGSKPNKIGAEERYRMVEVAAYFLAERSKFAGSPLGYWTAAEAQISKLLKK